MSTATATKNIHDGLLTRLKALPTATKGIKIMPARQLQLLCWRKLMTRICQIKLKRCLLIQMWWFLDTDQQRQCRWNSQNIRVLSMRQWDRKILQCCGYFKNLNFPILSMLDFSKEYFIWFDSWQYCFVMVIWQTIASIVSEQVHKTTTAVDKSIQWKHQATELRPSSLASKQTALLVHQLKKIPWPRSA